MSVTKSEPKVSAQRSASTPEITPEQQHFIESQNHCALCNGLLKIHVESYLEDYYLREEAECGHCGVKTRVKNHKMQ